MWWILLSSAILLALLIVVAVRRSIARRRRGAVWNDLRLRGALIASQLALQRRKTPPNEGI